MSNFEPVETASMEFRSLFERVVSFFAAFLLGHLLGCSLSRCNIYWENLPLQAFFITPTRSSLFLITAPVLGTCLLLIIFSSLPRIPILYTVFAVNTVSAFVNEPYDHGPRDYSPNLLAVVGLLFLLSVPVFIWRHIMGSRKLNE